jgi:hypothetical protein
MAHTPKPAAFTEPLPTGMDRLPVNTNPSQAVSADARVETPPIRNALYDSDEATKRAKTARKVKTARKREDSMAAHHAGPSRIPELEPDDSTIDDIVQTVKRSVHQLEAESFLLT